MNANLRTLLRVQWLLAWRGLLESAGGKSRWRMLLLPLIVLPLLPMMVMAVALYTALFVGGKAIGQGHLVLTVGLAAGQIACLTFGIFYVISVFYYSDDLTVLVPLPLRPGEIILSKFLTVMAGEYLTMAPLVLPALVVYGVLADVSVLYIPFAIIIFLLLPIIPLVIASLFSLLLMRLTNLRQNRDLWRVIGALFGVGLALVFQIAFRGGAGMRLNGQIDAVSQWLLAGDQAQVRMVARFVPTSLWATNALRESASGYGIAPLLVFTGAAVLALLLLLWAAERLFFGGLLGGTETRAASRALSQADFNRETERVHTPLWAMLQREVRLFNRTPSFVMAGVLPLVVMPFMVVLPFLQGGPELRAEVHNALQQLDVHLIPVIAVGIITLLGTMSNLPATAISREGRFFWISRSLPVPPRLQIHAKVLHSLLLAAVITALTLGGLLFAGLWHPLTAFYVLVGGMLASTVVGYVGICLDLFRPNLRWTDPQKAMRGNINGLFNLGLLIVMGLLGTVLTLIFNWMSPALIMPGLVLVLGPLAVVFGRVAGALAERRYLEYED